MYYQIDIKHQHIDVSKVSILKAIRTLSPSISLKSAIKIRKYISNHDCTLVAGISVEVASHVQAIFAKVGVESEINGSSIMSPMLLVPDVKVKWKWSLLGVHRAI